VTQLVFPLHECAVEPLHSATDHAAVGAAPIETSCLCVRV
jgi:hypothetical protein